VDPGAAVTRESAIETARALFGPRGFGQVEKLAKGGQLDAATSNAAAEGRRQMIAEALRQTVAELDPGGDRLAVGALDSGNKNSGSASDIDQTIFAMGKDGGPPPFRPAHIIETFNRTFQRLYGHHPDHFGIESMDGDDFYPDWRAAHRTLEEFREEARRVVLAKRDNPEAYRSEGELKVQAEGRGYEAIRSHFEELRSLERSLADAVERAPNPDADPAVRRLRAEIAEHQRLSPWAQYETRVDAEGNRTVVETKDVDPLRQIMPNQPELVRRFAFDGSYDNWIMWVAHPANRPKYLLRSVADGVGLLTYLRPGDGRYDLDRPWMARTFEYDKVYGDMFGAEGQRAQMTAENARLQFIRDIYGGLDATEGGLTTERIRRALDAASKARLKHKGHPRFASATERDIYAEYLPDPDRIAGLTPERQLALAKVAWEADAREIMLENLLRTVRAPGDIVRGWGDPDEWRAILDNPSLTPEQRAIITPSRLRAASWLQLYNGFLDLMTDDHARQILQGLEEGRRPLEVTGRPQGRVPDMVDRLVLELQRSSAPDAAEARAELEKVLIDAAATRRMLNPALGEARLGLAVADVIRSELGTRMVSAQTAIAEWQESFARVRQDMARGVYTPAVVADRVIMNTADRLARASAGVLATLGFEGEISVRQTITHLGEIEQRGIPEIEIRLTGQRWSARQALTGMATTANADSFLQVIHAYQTGGPEAAARQVVWELWMNVPGVSQANSVWQGVDTGNWQGAFMAGTGMMIPVVGQGYILVNIATSSVRIVGHMVLEPLRQDDIDRAYQGFLGAENDFLSDQRGQRVNVLANVPIRVIPHEVENEDGGTVTEYLFSEYPKEEAIRVLVEQSGADTGIDFGPVPLDTVHAVALEAGALGGGPGWDRLLPRAQDWLNEPRLNFEAKRASLFPFYGARLDAWIRNESGANADHMDELLATYPRSEVVELLVAFFEPLVRDWAYGRGDFEDIVGGENELMVPWTDEEQRSFFGGIARRMAGDLIRSYRIVRLNPVVNAEGGVMDASYEAQLARAAYQAVDQRLKEAATSLTAMVDDARKGISVPVVLGDAVHEIRLRRNEFEEAKPHVHVRARVVPGDEVEFGISVVADSVRFPLPYRHEVEWLLEDRPEADDAPDGLAELATLAAIVRVRDRNGAQVGDSAFVRIGEFSMQPDLIALEALVEARISDPDAPEDAPAPPAPPPARAGPAGAAAPIPGLLIYDDIRVYFQPARDTTATAWAWRMIRDDSARIGNGLYVPADSFHNTTRRAPPGSPAPFEATPYGMWGPRGVGGGRFRFETCEVFPLTILGQTNSYHSCGLMEGGEGTIDSGETWQVEGEFEMGEVDFVLKDFVAERGAVEFDAATRGQLRLEAVRLEGDGGTADAVVGWSECVRADRPDDVRAPPCAEPGEGWREVRRTARTRVRIGLPATLSLADSVMGDMQVRAEVVEAGRDLAIQVFDLTPGSAIDRDLAAWNATNSTAEVHPTHDGEGRASGSQQAVPVDGRARPYHIHQRYRRDVGEPSRPLGLLIRDARTKWFLPVKVTVGRTDLYAFAVYGPTPGPWDGAIPTAPGAVTVIADADPSGGDPGRDEPGGPLDPATLDPNAPDVSGLIREWIGVAKPPNSVEDDVDWHYDEWGRQVGERAGFIATATAPPDDRGANTPEAYVWDRRDILDSVDHCTVGEYVVRSLEGTGIAECNGRYVASPRAPDYTGRPVAAVTSELESSGYAVAVSIADWPTRPDQANTVLRQTPGPGARLPAGTTVRLGIYGPYQEPAQEPAREEGTANRTVVGVYGLTFDDARAILADSGFAVAAPVGGDPAPTQDLAFRVAGQSVAGGERRTVGAEVRLTLFGPYSDVRGRGEDEVPPPRPVDPVPSCNDLVRAANRAQGRGDLSGAYELYRTAVGNGCSNPGLRDAMESVYQSPRCTQLVRDARGAYDRGDFQGAIRALRDAERGGCDMSGLGPLVDGTLTALETGVAEAMGQSCSGLAAEIAAARRRGDEGTAQALTTTALVQGCSGDEITSAAATPIGNRPTQPGGGIVSHGTGGVALTEPRSGLVTRERVIPVAGQVTDPAAQRITLVVNDEQRPVSVENGRFRTMVPLVAGQNSIQAFLSSSAFSDRVLVQADVPAADVWLQLTWDGPADIDLHLYLPNGEHVYYADKQSSAGAALDVDNTQRDGPEHITMVQAIPGEYRVLVRYFGRRNRAGGDQVPWQVTVRLRGGQVAQRFSGVLNRQGEETVVHTFIFR
jgi:hypothetical protein